MSTIRTGDTVLHRPTGETWTVAYVRDDRLAWCGWPSGTANLHDCELVKSATDEQSISLIRMMAEMPMLDHRRDWARRQLAALAGPEESA